MSDPQPEDQTCKTDKDCKNLDVDGQTFVCAHLTGEALGQKVDEHVCYDK